MTLCIPLPYSVFYIGIIPFGESAMPEVTGAKKVLENSFYLILIVVVFLLELKNCAFNIVKPWVGPFFSLSEPLLPNLITAELCH
jgi:hypothetical protein